MKHLILAVAAIAALGGPAVAKPHGDGPPGQVKKEEGNVPPGLAKKGGLPPGQAKKLWGKGEVLPRTYIAPTYYVGPVRYRLPPPPYGSRWVVVDGRAYLVRTETGLIMDVVSDLLSRR
ncbi:MAG: RcnB family protein [Caulobacteraceae bacterium]